MERHLLCLASVLIVTWACVGLSGCSMLTAGCTSGLLCDISKTRGDAVADLEAGLPVESTHIDSLRDGMSYEEVDGKIVVSLYREKTCFSEVSTPRKVESVTKTRLNFVAYSLAALGAGLFTRGVLLEQEAESIRCTTKDVLACLDKTEKQIEAEKLYKAPGGALMLVVGLQLLAWDTVREWEATEPEIRQTEPFACGRLPSQGHAVTLILPDGYVDRRRADEMGRVFFDLNDYPPGPESGLTSASLSYGYRRQERRIDLSPFGWK